jgi:Arc/MetJ-type ribon-helix-helix transcriptional regulator
MPHSKAEQAEIAERRAQLVRLRRIGVPFDDERILSLGYSSRSHATKDLVRALKERSTEQAAEVSVYRQQENERLDALLEAVWTRATKPSPIFDREGMQIGEEIDTKAIDTVLRLMDRRAKLNGYDMPVKTELSGPDGGAIPFSSDELDELTALIEISGDPTAVPPQVEHDDDSDA